ncbi:MAG: T9SS type A sorting domain-containing protein, partial [Flavobacteriales bacterium]
MSLSAGGSGILDATCADTEDGGIFLVGLGGNAPATIEFSVDGMNFGPSPVTVSGGTYTVIAQDVYGCQGTLSESVVVGPAAIEVNAMAMAEVCFEGNDGEVSWAPVGGEGAYTYLFNGEATTSTSASDLAPGEYEVVVTDGNNCSSTATVTVDAGVAIVASTSVIDAECAGENDGEVTVTAEGGSGAFQYSDDGVNFADGNVFDELNAGSYTFFVQDEFGCSGSVTANVSEPAAIEISGIVSEGAATGEGSIDINITGGLPPYEYEWIGPGVSGTTDQDLTGISTGVYIVEVTDANGCSSDETFNLTTSIQEIAAGVVASVFPNPSQGLFAVEIAGQTQGAVEYHVLDAQGRMLTQGQWVGAGQLFRETLDLTGADAGLYQLVLVANGR